MLPHPIVGAPAAWHKKLPQGEQKLPPDCKGAAARTHVYKSFQTRSDACFACIYTVSLSMWTNTYLFKHQNSHCTQPQALYRFEGSTKAVINHPNHPVPLRLTWDHYEKSIQKHPNPMGGGLTWLHGMHMLAKWTKAVFHCDLYISGHIIKWSVDVLILTVAHGTLAWDNVMWNEATWGIDLVPDSNQQVRVSIRGITNHP